jgi:hypothetical protein
MVSQSPASVRLTPTQEFKGRALVGSAIGVQAK